jgi:hypothetical protein
VTACSSFSAAVITATPTRPATTPRPAAGSSARPRPVSPMAATAPLVVRSPADSLPVDGRVRSVGPALSW